nr:MAG TPA: hypothetical protein [Caudoviricetes sp.]
MFSSDNVAKISAIRFPSSTSFLSNIFIYSLPFFLYFVQS